MLYKPNKTLSWPTSKRNKLSQGNTRHAGLASMANAKWSSPQILWRLSSLCTRQSRRTWTSLLSRKWTFSGSSISQRSCRRDLVILRKVSYWVTTRSSNHSAQNWQKLISQEHTWKYSLQKTRLWKVSRASWHKRQPAPWSSSSPTTPWKPCSKRAQCSNSNCLLSSNRLNQENL